MLGENGTGVLSYLEKCEVIVKINCFKARLEGGFERFLGVRARYGGVNCDFWDSNDGV
jgi:hypothetical protein